MEEVLKMLEEERDHFLEKLKINPEDNDAQEKLNIIKDTASFVLDNIGIKF